MFNVTQKFSKSAPYIYSFVLYGYLRVTVASDDGRTFTATCGGAHGEQATTHTMTSFRNARVEISGRAKGIARVVAQKHLAEGRGVRGRAYTVDHLNVNISLKVSNDQFSHFQVYKIPSSKSLSDKQREYQAACLANRKHHLLTLKKGGYIGKPEDKGVWILR